MNKELEALEKLCDIALCDCSTNELNRIANYKNIVETALKDYEELKNKYDLLETEYCDQQRSMLKYDEVKYKKLKALEIIKKKRVDVDLLLKSEDSEMYNAVFENWNRPERFYLTQEEFDLLKEVLL